MKLFGKKDPNETALIYCPKCSRQLEVPYSYLGKKGECPCCGEKFIMKLPKRVSQFKKQAAELALLLFAIVALMLAKFVSKEVSHKVNDLRPARRVEIAFNTMSEQYENESREFRDAIARCGIREVLDDESYERVCGLKDRSKTGKAINTAIRATKRFDEWCKGMMRDFKTDESFKNAKELREAFYTQWSIWSRFLEAYYKYLNSCKEVHNGKCKVEHPTITPDDVKKLNKETNEFLRHQEAFHVEMKKCGGRFKSVLN